MKINAMNVIVANQIVTIQPLEPMIEHTTNVYTATFQFDEMWDGFAKSLVWYNGESFDVYIMDSELTVEIPKKVIETGKLYVGVHGFNEYGQILTTRHSAGARIHKNGGEMTIVPDIFTPTEFERLMAELADVRIVVGEQNTEMENALQTLEAGLAHVDIVENAVAQLKAQAETAKDAAINAQNETEAIAQQVNADKQQVSADTQTVEQLKTQAQASATQAQQSATNAQASATSASNSATTATSEANKAKASEEEAKRQAEEAERQAKLAEETVASVAPAITELENTKAELHKLYFDGDSIFRSFADWEEYIPMTFDEVYDLCYQEKNFVYIGDGQMKYYPQLDLHVGTKPHSIEFISTAQLDGKNMHTRIIITEDELVKTNQIIDTPWFTHVADVADLTAENEQLQTQINSLERQNKAQQRSIDALMKVNEGVVYEYQTDTDEAYSKDVLSGAITGAFLNIGGNSVVWNQFHKVDKGSQTRDGVNYVVDKVNNVITVTGGTPSGSSTFWNVNNRKRGSIYHKYFAMGCPKNGSFSSWSMRVYEDDTTRIAVDYGYGVIFSLSNDGMRIDLEPTIAKDYVINTPIVFKPRLIDLTQMFGAGNEPTSVDDERIKMIEAYVAEHPAYNAGEIVSATVDDVVAEGRNLLNLNDARNDWRRINNGLTKDATINNNEVIMDCVGASISAFPQVTFNSDYIFKKGKTYTISYEYDSIHNPNPALLFYFFKDGVSIKEIALYRKQATSLKLVMDFDYDYVSTNIRADQQRQTSGIVRMYNIQITESETALPYSPYTEQHHPIPTAIQQLDGYGWSAGNVYNEVDYVDKVYIKRVDMVNGELVALQTPITTDISTLLDGFDNIFDTETGGSVTFHQSNGGMNLPVPNTMKYMIKLSEVTS